MLIIVSSQSEKVCDDWKKAHEHVPDKKLDRPYDVWEHAHLADNESSLADLRYKVDCT